MEIRIVNYFLAVLGLAGHLFLNVVLIRRKLAVKLPLFTILTMFYLLRSAILFLASFGSISAWPYWTLITLDPVLQCVLFATIIHAWWPPALESKILRALADFSLFVTVPLVSGLAAWFIGPSSHFSPENLYIKAGVFVSVLWIEAEFGVIASSAGFLRPLPAFTQKVVRGFAIYSAADVITEIGHKNFAALRAAPTYLGLSYMRVGVYLLCLAVWITACYQEPRPNATRAR
ncbi:MAG TPA: hypothetical protein VKB47_14280 [Terracidiphilus sp.]|nr:hypothetical protein [Terracidiphilus sp.]